MATKRARKPKGWETYLKAQARRIWGWSIEKKKALKRASVGRINGREAWRCEECGTEPLFQPERDVDHLESVENVGVWDGWDAWLGRLFCPADGLQIKCKPCHSQKTVSQSAERRAARKANK